jgi:hypothetical protein
MRGASYVLMMCAVTAAQAQTFTPLDMNAEAVVTDVYTVSASYGDDTFAMQVGGDWAASDALRIQLDAGFTDSGNDDYGAVDITTYRARLGMDYAFDPIGITLAYEYWGDTSNIDTHAALASLYFRNDFTYASLKGERRRIELSYDVPPLFRNLIDDSQVTYSTGYGAYISQRIESLTLRANGMKYDYDTPLGDVNAALPSNLRPVAQVLVNRAALRWQALNATSLSLSDSLLDRSMGVGVEFAFDDKALAVDGARERFVGDDVELTTIGIGWIAPLKSVGDLETRVSYSRADEYGASLYFGFTMWIYR